MDFFGSISSSSTCQSNVLYLYRVLEISLAQEKLGKMTIHAREGIGLAVLQYVADEKEYLRKDILVTMADHFSQPYIPSTAPSEAKVFRRKCISAIKHLKDGNLLEQPKPRHYKITDRGIEFLRQSSESPEMPETIDDRVNSRSEESIDDDYQQIRRELAEELLLQIAESTPRFFEELVIDLLVNMGYGGSRRDAEAVGRSGDGGIDGVINEDRLGLDVIYVQAKRWGQNVGAQPVRDFIGALQYDAPAREFSSQRQGFPKVQKNVCQKLNQKTARLYLLMGANLPSS